MSLCTRRLPSTLALLAYPDRSLYAFAVFTFGIAMVVCDNAVRERMSTYAIVDEMTREASLDGARCLPPIAGARPSTSISVRKSMGSSL